MKPPSDLKLKKGRGKDDRTFAYALEQILRSRTRSRSHTMGLGAGSQRVKRIEECENGAFAPWLVDEVMPLSKHQAIDR
jgi:hypothetical protein